MTNLVLIDTKSGVYKVFEDRKEVGMFQSQRQPTLAEIEELRNMSGDFDGEDPDGDLEA